MIDIAKQEELFELQGRIKAFEAYINTEKYSIDRKIARAMLGLAEPVTEEEE